MNELNVEALAEALEPLLRDATLPWGTMSGKLLAKALAKRLASQGVLVPGALTNEECSTVERESHEDYEGFLLEDEFRCALERIAKGEET